MIVTVLEAISLLKQGKIVALPTETVYGLAATVSNPFSIQKIFDLKGRPQDNPLIVHLASLDQITPFIQAFPPFYLELAQAFWPGPFTCVLPIKEGVLSSAICAGLSTCAFRIPSHPLTLAVLKETGPLVMPSANLSGKPSSTSAKHIEEDFGRDFPVLDGGPCQRGVESTILFYEKKAWHLLRWGAITKEQVEQVLGGSLCLYQGKMISPGQKYRHYAPKAKLILTEKVPSIATAILGFERRPYPKQARLFSLGSDLDPEQIASRLYDQLRALDLAGIKQAWVDMDFPKRGLFLTIAERLKKAATPP